MRRSCQPRRLKWISEDCHWTELALDLEQPIAFGDASPGHSNPVSGSIQRLASASIYVNPR
jgi:hypothetical protein